jgi:hypothetical protein
MKKHFNAWKEKDHQAVVTIELNDGKLSIAGVVGAMANGDCWGSCGQIDMSFTEIDAGGHLSLADVSGDRKTIARLLNVWRRFHSNDLQAGCIHQQREGWNKRPIDPTKPLTAYGKHYSGQQYNSYNMLTWVSYKEYRHGLLGKACKKCGHRYGTAWLRKEVPDWAIRFLESLPNDAKLPGSWGR